MPLRDTRARLSRSLLMVPLITMLVILILGMLKISGSSIALQSETDPSAQAVGTPRPVRSDEWLIRTPLVIRQATLGFPTRTDIGIGEHDTGVLSDLPVKSLSALVKPHSWAYFVVDVERAFAIEWWLNVLGPFIGIYVVMALVTRSRLVSVLSGLLVAGAPVALWWSIPSAGMSILYGGLTAALLIAACRRTGWKRIAMGACAGWAAGCFAAVLYLPWLVPLALIFGAIVLSQMPGAAKGWRDVAALAASFSGVFAVLMAIFYREHHAALQAIANSVYPGQRINVSGEARPVLMFGSPFDVFATRHQLVAVSATNQSEASSGFMLWLPIALVGGALTGFRSRLSVARALAAVETVALILAAWAFLPVPSRLGALLGLTRVQGSRLALPLTVAGAVAAGLYIQRMKVDGSFRPGRDRILIGGLGFAFVTGWVATQISIDGVAPSRMQVLALIVLVCVGTLSVLKGRVVLGLGGLCLLALFGSVQINPMQVGLGPVMNSPLLHEINDVRAGDDTKRWAALGLDDTAKSILVASGAPTATGTSWYADSAAWRQLDPPAANRDTWDRFALIAIEIDETADDIPLELSHPDYIVIHTPTCAGVLQTLNITYVITDDAVTSECLQLVRRPVRAAERWIYQVVAPANG